MQIPTSHFAVGRNVASLILVRAEGDADHQPDGPSAPAPGGPGA